MRLNIHEMKQAAQLVLDWHYDSFLMASQSMNSFASTMIVLAVVVLSISKIVYRNAS